MRGTQSTTDHHRVTSPQGDAEDGSDPVPVVAHLRLEVGIDAGLGEALADPRGVRIDALTKQKLGPDSDDFTCEGHSGSGLCLPTGRSDRPGGGQRQKCTLIRAKRTLPGSATVSPVKGLRAFR